MAQYPAPIERLIQELMHLPGVGPKTAERYVFSLLRMQKDRLHDLGSAVEHLRDNITSCQRCHNFDDQSPCRICADKHREPGVICVVTEAPDLAVIEHTGVYHGVYHVLGGTVNVMEGQGPERLHIDDLLKRIEAEKISEVILAMNPDIEGETTALYLKKALAPLNTKITQLARGIPSGGDVTYLDEATLTEAINHRQAT